MPRSSDPFKNINWQTAPPLHDLTVSVGEHFSDARAGNPLAVNELVEDCMKAFKALGILPATIIAMMNSVYGLNPTLQPERPVMERPSNPVQPVQPKQPEPAEKKGSFFNR